MHSAPTLGPACAHTVRALRPCRPCHVVSWCALASCHGHAPVVSRAPSTVWRAVTRAVSPSALARCCAYCRSLRRIVALPTSYRGTSPGSVAPVLQYNPEAKPPSYHDSNDFIVTHLNDQAALLSRAHIALCPCARPAVSWPVSTVLQALPGSIARPYCAPLRTCALACHDTIHCIMTQGWKMGSNPSSFPALFFFFFHLFYWKTTQKNI